MKSHQKVALFAPSFLFIAINALSPALASIAVQFPDAGEKTAQLLITLPYLVSFPLVLVSGRLTAFFTKKKLLIISTCIMIIGALLPLVFHESITPLLISSIIFGIGLGLFSTPATSILSEHFPPERHGTVLGFQSTVVGAGGMIFSLLGGYLANIKWWYAYFSFLLFIPILLLVLMLPAGKLEERGASFGGLFNGRLNFYLVMCIISDIAFAVFLTNISFLITDSGMGNAETTGFAVSLYSLIGVAMGFVIGHIIAALKKQTLTACHLVAAAAMLMLSASRSVAMVMLGTFTLGLIYALRMPAGYLKATGSVAPRFATLAIAVYCCASQAGMFLSPFAMNFISRPLGDTAQSRFLTAGIIFVAMTLVSFLFETRRRSNVAKY